MYNLIIRQQKQIFSNLIKSFFNENWDILPSWNKSIEKEISTEELKETNLEKMIDLVAFREIDLKKEDHKEFIKRFLIELSKKNWVDWIQEDDVNNSVFSRERWAFNKVISLLRTLEEYKNVESKLKWYTKAELNMLNEFIWRTLVVKEETQKQTKELSYEIDPSNIEHVYRSLFDFNLDNIVDEKDKNILNNDFILTYVEKMIKDWKEDQLLSSISYILWEEVSSKEDLYNLTKTNPEKKTEFIQKLSTLSQTVFITDILEYWKDSVKKSLEKKQNVEKYINSLFEKEKENFYKSYDNAIINFENKLSIEDKKKYELFLERLNSESLKRSIFDNFKLNWVWLLVSFIDTRKWALIWASFSNVEFDKYLRKISKDIVSWVNFDVWVTNISWILVPWIWMNFNLEKSFSESVKWFSTLWIVNFIPFGLVWLNVNTNKEDLKKSWFMDFNDAKYAWFTINFIPLWWWVWTHYEMDKISWIMQQENNFSKFLDEFITPDWLNEDIMKIQNDYEKNKIDYDKLLSNIKESFRIIWFDNLSVNQKKYVIDWIKKWYINYWRQSALIKANKEWYDFSWFWIWVQFIAWFLPLPYIWAKWTKVGLSYEEDKISKNYAVLSEFLKIQDWKYEVPTKRSSLETNPFEENISLFQSIAIRHKKDWPALIEKSPTFDQKVENVLKILKTDKNRNNKVFKDLVKEIEILRISDDSKDREKLNDRISQFFDIAFKDKRDIEEVIMWYTKEDWKSYNFIESRYRAVSIFSQQEWLSNNFSLSARQLYSDLQEKYKWNLKEMKSWQFKIPQVKKPDLYWFVASYKLDATWKKRLATWFVDIPAWQTTVAWWIEKPVLEEQDKKWAIDKFIKSEYGKKTMDQIIKLLADRWLEIDENDFRELLLNWSINKNWKEVKLNAEFVYFLYWRCANESIWIRFKDLELDWFNTIFWDIWPDWILRIKANTTNMSRWNRQNIWVGVIFWQWVSPNLSPNSWSIWSGSSISWWWQKQPGQDSVVWW